MEPADTAGYLLQHVANVLHRQSDQALQEQLGIGLAQLKILTILLDQPRLEQRALADSLGQTEASVSRQIKLLAEKGMVISKIDPTERRRHLAAPTTKGIKITQAAKEVLRQFHAPIFAALSDKQKAQLQELLSMLHKQSCASGKSMACAHPASASPLT